MVNTKKCAMARDPETGALKYPRSKEKKLMVIPVAWEAALCVPIRPQSGATACDEHPLFATLEGGPRSSLRVIDHAHNKKEGDVYGGMTKHKKCEMQHKFGSGKNKFMVIPASHSRHSRCRTTEVHRPPTF